MTDSQTFLGRGWSFPHSDSSDGRRTLMSEREEDIHQSLHILFSTTPGERTMRPDFGCNLKAMVFETLTETNLRRIEAEVERAVLFFEPRIDLLKVTAAEDNSLEGRLLIQLSYRIRATNSRSNMVFPFYHAEGTHLRLAESSIETEALS